MSPAPCQSIPIYRYNDSGSIIATGDRRHIRGDRGVLLIRNAGLGDVLLCTPLIRALASREGVAAVDVWTSRVNAPLFDHNPHVRAMAAIEDTEAGSGECNRLRSRYDAVIDLRGHVEHPAHLLQHRVLAFLACAGLTEADAGGMYLDYFRTEEEDRWAASMLAQMTRRDNEIQGRGADPGPEASGPVIGYVWDSTNGARNWSGATHRRMIAALTDRGYRVALLSANPLPEWHGLPGVLNFAGGTTVRECAAILSRCAAVVSPDTGLYHLAAALQVPTVGYFGAFPPEDRVTHAPGRFLALGVLKGACPIQPCRGYQCVFPGESGEPACIHAETADLLTSIDRLLGEAARYENRLEVCASN